MLSDPASDEDIDELQHAFSSSKETSTARPAIIAPPLAKLTRTTTGPLTVSGATAQVMFEGLQADKKRGKFWLPEDWARKKKRFDWKNKLPKDMRRVVGFLKERFTEDYALKVVFLIRTAVELHRAYHMTMITSRILNELKKQLGLRVTFNLGVLRLTFYLEDGGFVLQRNVPYDYDSEFQDLYSKIASSLANRQIDVHTALIFQDDTIAGKHTSPLGLFFRNYPTRIAIYPIEAATCCVVFFGGSWNDGLVALVTGFVSGILQYGLSFAGEVGALMTDLVVGVSTGMIAGYYFDYVDGKACISGIALGTLYWFFYGTAFVLGILEIISGELETGVIRFVAVCVKTFVLCLGTSLGLDFVLVDVPTKWAQSGEHCGVDLDIIQSSWRMPLYILCSLACLMQYRFPPKHYWRGLVIQIVAYEIQYQCQEHWYRVDNSSIDLAVGNLFAASASVVAVSLLFACLARIRRWYYHTMMGAGRLENKSAFDRMRTNALHRVIHVGSKLKVIRATEIEKVHLSKKLRLRRRARTRFKLRAIARLARARVETPRSAAKADEDRAILHRLQAEEKKEEQAEEQAEEQVEISQVHVPVTADTSLDHDSDHDEWELVEKNETITFEEAEHDILLETVVSSQDTDMWSVLMPAVYMLVPGSMIAKLWFEAIFPTNEKILCTEETEAGLNGTSTRVCMQHGNGITNVFGNLMTISTSLALGLLVGLCATRILWKLCACLKILWKLCACLQCRRAKKAKGTPHAEGPNVAGAL
jgi:hypothetical protein